MTSWAPELPVDGGDHYWAIVSALARDIGTGTLKPGQRLPPHRELAEQLGLAVGTVTKAYSEAKRLGYIRSTVGSGTFVREHPLKERRRLMTDREEVGRVDLSFSKPILFANHLDLFRKALEEQARSETIEKLLSYHRPWIGFESHRRTGRKWMLQLGYEAEPGDIAVVSGAQHGLSVALLTSARAGDIIATEALIDPSTRLLLGGLGLNIRGVAMDRHGILPDAFADVCRSEKIRALLCVPDHHSPTLAVWPAERRQAIAEIAQRHGVTIIENAVYRPLAGTDQKPLASYAPEISYFCSSVSKFAVPGLRVGFLAVPPGHIDDIVLGLGTTLWMTSPLTAEIVCQWIETGRMDDLLDMQRTELAARNAIAAEVLEGTDYAALPTGLHVWLRLPERWRSSAFEREARASGVLVSAGEVFATAQAPDAVRISLGGGAETREALTNSLSTVKALLNRKVGSILDF